MEPQNTAPSSSSHLLPSNFTAGSTFPVQFAAGLNAATNNSNGNVSSPLFMHTLQQLSGLSNGLLQPNAQFATNQFSATDLANWNSQTMWFDQAKMAAMYLQTAVSGGNDPSQIQNNVSAIMEQNFKNQTAAAVAAAAVSNLQTNTTASQNGNNFHTTNDRKKQHTNAHAGHESMVAPHAVFGNPGSVPTPTQPQQQGHVKRMSTQPHCPQTASQHHMPHKFQHQHPTQLPANGPIHSPLAAASGPESSPRNNSRLLQHQSTSYPSSSSSHPPSNEGMAESPLSTYSNVSHRVHHQQSHEQGMMDACGSPYANYHSPFMQQQQQQQQSHNHNQSLHSPPQLVLNNNCKPPPTTTTATTMDTTNQNLLNLVARENVCHASSLALNNSSPHEHARTFANNQQRQRILQDEILHNSPHTAQNPNVQQQNANQQTRHSNAVTGGMGAYGHVSGVPVVMADNEEELSILDLHDFEEFLNDKDAVAAALTADPAALFNESVDNAATNVENDLNIPKTTAMSDSLKTLAEGRKNCSANSTATISSPLVTSAKMRERIHERRAEELANADKELDRLVSLVARQNDAKFVQNTFQSPKANNSLSMFNFDLLGSAKLSNQNKLSPLDLSNTSETLKLNPVQFTPPDSPTGLESSLTSSASSLAAKNQLASNLLSSTLSSLKSQINNSAQTKSTPLRPQLNHSIASQLSAIPSTSQPSSSTAFDPTRHSMQRKEALKMMENATKNFGVPAAKAQPLVFIPTSSASLKTPTISGIGRVAKGGMANVKYNRVPIYKQRIQSSIFPTRELIKPPVVAKKTSIVTKAHASPLRKGESADAYSFTDDDEDEDETAIPTSSNAPNPYSSNNNGIVKARGSKNSDSINSQSITHKTPENSNNSRTQRKQRRQNTSSSDTTTVVSAAPASASFSSFDNSPNKKSQSTQIIDFLRRRRNERLNFVKSIDCMDNELETNDAFAPDEMDEAGYRAFSAGAGAIGERRPTATCMIKMEAAADQPSPTIPSNGISSGEKEAKALPKLVIKFIKPEPVEIEPVSEVQEDIKKEENLLEDGHGDASPKQKRQRKKRKKKDRDRDWFDDSESHEKRRKGSHHHHHHKKHKRDKRHRSLNSLNDPADNADVPSLCTRHMSIDQSIFPSSSIHLNGTSNLKRKYNEINKAYHDRAISNDHPTPKKSARQLALEEMDFEFVRVRLRSFSRSHGALPKGTFLVAKEDVFKRECPLWKIDNQNLLQKYPQILVANDCEIRYKNSSTYSGWCDRIADDYWVVEVKFVKQSRAENIIEPMVPIRDLFPAVTSELTEKPLALIDEDKRNIPEEQSVQENDTPDKFTEQFRVFIKALLKHSVTPNFLENIRSTNDWNYLCAVNEIDHRITKTTEKLLEHIKWTDRFLGALRFYPNMVVDADCPSHLCQACSSRSSSSSIQLFSGEMFNDESLTNIDSKSDQFQTCPAIEFAVCTECERLSTLYHGNFHAKYHLFRKSEENLEKIAVEFSSCPTDALIEQCLQDKVWFQNVTKQYLELWRKCDNL